LLAAAAHAKEASRCIALLQTSSDAWPDPSTHVVFAALRPAGPYTPEVSHEEALPPAALTLPEHCEVFGVLHERVGVDGQNYAIRFHLRLPTQWNGRFFFQGGGGANGVVGDALGFTSNQSPPAILQGFAVVSQDSGHDNTRNFNPTRGGSVAFGFDPQARADYGYASLPVVADAAKAVVRAYYGKPPQYSYFVGCSKGGQEGIEFAERYPAEFDGIVAAAPGISLPRAALAEAWDVQSLAAASEPADSRKWTLRQLADAFSDADLGLVRDAILAACDVDDGVKDGIIGNFPRCLGAKVRPALEIRRCVDGKTASCLSTPQISALERLYGGAHNTAGTALYSDWQWDTGIAAPEWRLWKLGSADHTVPALNVVLGGTSLATVFTVPPTPLSVDPNEALAYQMAFDFDRDAAKIDAADAPFPHSAWEDIAARTDNLKRFRAHGGKLIVPHGVSDPVFSIRDTLAWYGEVDADNRGQANRFLRVFPVPGMAHCGGGPATDRYDAFAALIDWVEHHRAPDRILASAGENTPWPGRTRPLCAFPRTAHYIGRGDIEIAESFICR
jgi:feruloyl esterase